MARLIDANSTRQLAFDRLGDEVLMECPRQLAVNTIMDEFDLPRGYAKTLYQQHRKQMIDTGILIETYKVRERDGKPVVVIQFKTRAQSKELTDAYTTRKRALGVYKRGVEARLRAVEKLQAAG